MFFEAGVLRISLCVHFYTIKGREKTEGGPPRNALFFPHCSWLSKQRNSHSSKMRLFFLLFSFVFVLQLAKISSDPLHLILETFSVHIQIIQFIGIIFICVGKVDVILIEAFS